MGRPGVGAFTLIEALVVTAILSVLASMLFPVFATAREKARQGSCVANEHQIAVAMLCYTGDWDDMHVVGRASADLGASFADLSFTNVAKRLDPYTKSTQVLHCPSDAIERAGGDELGEAVSYATTRFSANPALPWFRREGVVAVYGEPSRRCAEIPAPGETVLLFEAWFQYNQWGFLALQPFSCALPGAPACIPSGAPIWPEVHVAGNAIGSHNALTTVAFCDGHVKALRADRLRSPRNLVSVDPSD